MLEEVFILYRYFEVLDLVDLLDMVGFDIWGIVICGEFGVDCVIIEVCLNFEIIFVYGVGCDVVDFEVCCK